MFKNKNMVKYINHIKIPPPFEMDRVYEVLRISSDEIYIWIKEFPSSPFLADRFEFINEQMFKEIELEKLEKGGDIDKRDDLAYKKLMGENLTEKEEKTLNSLNEKLNELLAPEENKELSSLLEEAESLLNKLKDGENK